MLPPPPPRDRASRERRTSYLRRYCGRGQRSALPKDATAAKAWLPSCCDRGALVYGRSLACDLPPWGRISTGISRRDNGAPAGAVIQPGRRGDKNAVVCAARHRARAPLVDAAKEAALF